MTAHATPEIEHTAEAEDTAAGHEPGLWELLERAVERAEGVDGLAEAAAELRQAVGELDGTYCECFLEPEGGWGECSGEDAAVQAHVDAEMAAITRRLDAVLALAAVRDAARRLCWIACQPLELENKADDDAEPH